MPKKFTVVDDYIAMSNDEARDKLIQLRSAIRDLLPEAEEIISYNKFRAAENLKKAEAKKGGQRVVPLSRRQRRCPYRQGSAIVSSKQPIVSRN